MNKNATIIISSLLIVGVVALVVWIILDNQNQGQLELKTCYTPEMARQQQKIAELPAQVGFAANYPVEENLLVERGMPLLSRMPVPNYTTVVKCLDGKHQVITLNLTA